IKFITVPFAAYEPDPNRLIWSEDADTLWKKIRNDQPLNKKLSSEVITAAKRPGSSASSDPSDDASDDASGDASDDSSSEATDEPSDDESSSDAADTAAANGLCS
ncbi:MAG: hypothetical protein L0H93_22190, partial [Nocardioides sp.]|nr:hypothetical protein [Nocardioides sp.]